MRIVPPAEAHLPFKQIHNTYRSRDILHHAPYRLLDTLNGLNQLHVIRPNTSVHEYV